MAATVDTIMERMIPELRDLESRGLFTSAEVSSIVARRREFEYLFAKRTPNPSDYTRALEYELSLESLRKLRRARLALRRTTVSDHAGVRRMHFIFDRACRRFRGTVAWWLQWLDFCLRTGSARAAARVVARALRIHPRSVELWLQAAAFEWDRLGNVASARALLLRALRVNGDSRTLWLAYFRMECLYVQKLRGRRIILGLRGGDATAASAGLVSADALAAGVGTAAEVGEVEGNDADADASAGYVPEDDDEADGAGGADDAEDVVAEVADVASGALGVGADDRTHAAGQSGSAAEVVDAKSAFLDGAVARIVFDRALQALPIDAALFRRFFDAAEAFTDPLTADSEALAAFGATAAPPAFPALSAHVLETAARMLPNDTGVWEMMASRGLAALSAAAARLAVERSRAEHGVTATATSASVSAMADEQLYAVDGAADEVAPLNPPETTSEHASTSASHDVAVETRRNSVHSRFNVPTSLLDWAAALGAGRVDAAVFSAEKFFSSETNDSEDDASGGGTSVQRIVLAPFHASVWRAESAAATATASAAHTGGSGSRKRKRGAAAVSPGSAGEDLPAPASCLVPAHGEASDPRDTLLISWASKVGASASSVFADVQNADKALHDALAPARARVYATLAALPVGASAKNDARVWSLLSQLASPSADEGDCDGGRWGDERLADLGAPARIAALLRMGRVSDALSDLTRAAAASTANALAHMRLLRILRDVDAALGDGALGPNCGGASVDAAPLAVGAAAAQWAPPAWRATVSAAPTDAALVRAAITRAKKNKASAAERAKLWTVGIEIAFGTTLGALQSASETLSSALLDGLGPTAEVIPRHAFITAALCVDGVRVADISPALAPSTPVHVWVEAVSAFVGRTPIVIADVRALVERAISAHGSHDARVWALAMRLEERALGAGEKARAQDVHARALRTLQGASLTEFLSGVAT